jgi:hypothetical protein
MALVTVAGVAAGFIAAVQIAAPPGAPAASAGCGTFMPELILSSFSRAQNSLTGPSPLAAPTTYPR